MSLSSKPRHSLRAEPQWGSDASDRISPEPRIGQTQHAFHDAGIGSVDDDQDPTRWEPLPALWKSGG